MPIRRDLPATSTFGTIEPAEDSETVDVEALGLANASMACAALALGIYIDTFV